VTALVLVVTLMAGSGLLSFSTTGSRLSNTLPLLGASIVTGVVGEAPVRPSTTQEQTVQEDFPKEPT
jgi:hypothetical protein